MHILVNTAVSPASSTRRQKPTKSQTTRGGDAEVKSGGRVALQKTSANADQRRGSIVNISSRTPNDPTGGSLHRSKAP